VRGNLLRPQQCGRFYCYSHASFWRGGGEKEKWRKRESVRGLMCNSVKGFCVDLADRIPQESQCISRPRDGAKRLNSTAFCANIQGTGVALGEK